MCSCEEELDMAGLYWVTSTARSKLSKEADRKEHALRRLVGHANLLDNLMDEINEVSLRDDITAGGVFPSPDKDEELQEAEGDSNSDDDDDASSTESDEDEDGDEEEGLTLSLTRCPPSLPGAAGSVRCSKTEAHVCNCSSTHRMTERGRHPPSIEYTVEEVKDEDDEDEVALEEELGLRDPCNAAAHSYGRNLPDTSISTLLRVADTTAIDHRSVNVGVLECTDDADGLEE